MLPAFKSTLILSFFFSRQARLMLTITATIVRKAKRMNSDIQIIHVLSDDLADCSPTGSPSDELADTVFVSVITLGRGWDGHNRAHSSRLCYRLHFSGSASGDGGRSGGRSGVDEPSACDEWGGGYSVSYGSSRARIDITARWGSDDCGINDHWAGNCWCGCFSYCTSICQGQMFHQIIVFKDKMLYTITSTYVYMYECNYLCSCYVCMYEGMHVCIRICIHNICMCMYVYILRYELMYRISEKYWRWIKFGGLAVEGWAAKSSSADYLTPGDLCRLGWADL